MLNDARISLNVVVIADGVSKWILKSPTMENYECMVATFTMRSTNISKELTVWSGWR